MRKKNGHVEKERENAHPTGDQIENPAKDMRCIENVLGGHTNGRMVREQMVKSREKGAHTIRVRKTKQLRITVPRNRACGRRF